MRQAVLALFPEVAPGTIQPKHERTDMIPPTKHKLPAMACLSAMQKCVRRSMPREAMEFACELLHTSKGFHTMVWNRLQIISHEDLDTTAAPHVVIFVRLAAEQAKELYAKDPENPGAARMVLGNTIRLMCATPKSRMGDHFAAAIGLANLLEGKAPEIPDWANDGHTLVGKRLGRGLDYFRAESAKLVEPDGTRVEEDEYADEAYVLFNKPGGLGTKSNTKPEKKK